jgi:hypothetical protein
MMGHSIITCRTHETQCPTRATILAIYGCLEGHIYEIAVCDRHYNYTTIYGPTCKICDRLIEANEYLRIERLTLQHIRSYINQTRYNYRGGLYIG